MSHNKSVGLIVIFVISHFQNTYSVNSPGFLRESNPRPVNKSSEDCESTFNRRSCTNEEILDDQLLEKLDSIILNKKIPMAQRKECIDLVLQNVNNLKTTKTIDITFSLPPLIEEGKQFGLKAPCAVKKHGTYIPFNPSILKTNEGYYVSCRTAAYKFPSYKPLIRSKHHQNLNFFLIYNKNFELISEQKIPPITDNETLQKINEYSQFSDSRLITINNSLWASSVIVTPPPTNCLFRMVLMKLQADEENVFRNIEKIVFLDGPDAQRSEKNWMHFFSNGQLRFIYLYDPFIILEPNLETGSCKEISRYIPTLDFSGFRGSAAPILFENGYLMIIHELMKEDRSAQFVKLEYTHRFLYLDKNMQITKISLPFRFEGMSVEFCTSMTFDHTEKNLVLAAGIYDSKAKLFLVDCDYVKSLLRDVPI